MEISQNLSDKAKRDYLLVSQAIKGDQKAYAELLGLYRDSIYYMLLKMVKNKDDAEDLTIEAFGKAFKNIDLYTPSFAFSTWLFKIASNNAIDFLRSKKSSKKHVSIDTQDDDDMENTTSISLVATSLDPEENMISQQKEKLLKTIIKKLHPDYRQIIKMRYFDELAYNEIAEQLNLPLGTVKARLFRSRELLHTILKQSGYRIDRL